MLEFIVKYWAQWLFGIVAAGLTAAYRNLSKKIKAQKEENKAIKNGLLAILHDRLYQACTHYIEKGYIDLPGLKTLNTSIRVITLWEVTEPELNCIREQRNSPSGTTELNYIPAGDPTRIAGGGFLFVWKFCTKEMCKVWKNCELTTVYRIIYA